MRSDPDPNNATADEAVGQGPSETATCPLPGGPLTRLFLFPAALVAAVVGVWLLFGAIASGSPDWRQLVSELQTGSPRQRWVAAMQLAQLLSAQAEPGGDASLAENREVATALAALLDQQLQTAPGSDDHRKHQAFLARALGMLDAPDVVLPVLRRAAVESRDRDVRKNALASIAWIAGRAGQRRPLPESEALTEDLIRVSHDGDALLRQLSAYALGLCSVPAAQRRLQELLDDPDRNTRLNAAIGLARQGRTDGLPVFRAELDHAVTSPPPQQSPASSSADFERIVRLRNTLKAVARIAPRLTPAERSRLAETIRPLADTAREPGIRTAAVTALRAL